MLSTARGPAATVVAAGAWGCMEGWGERWAHARGVAVHVRVGCWGLYSLAAVAGNLGVDLLLAWGMGCLALDW